MESAMAMRVIQDKEPHIVEDDYGDYLIHVSIKFNVVSGKSDFRVSIGRRDEPMMNVGGAREADLQQEARDQGFAIGRAAIDDLLPKP
ncbi:hypothetical protein WM29_22720 [Burkholderia ubonensis]|nr:hypothetical protein WM29_22720 [Burkholderia ubonensis]